MTSTESALLGFLVNALWQVPLLALGGWTGAALLRRGPAAFRHQVWLVALALGLTVPLAGALRSPEPGRAWFVGAPLGGAEPAKHRAEAPAGGRTGAPRLFQGAAAPRGLLRAIGVGYACATLLLALRLVRAWRGTRRIARAAGHPPARLRAVAAECAVTLGLRPVELRVSDAVGTPLTFGLRSPTIVLPERFARTAAAESLRGVLAHELAHVRRRDCALNLLVELLALPLWFHPVVRLLRRRLAGARESACDEAAARVIGARAYAALLLDVAEQAARRPRLAGAVGVLDGDCLEDRMEKLLEDRPRAGRRRAIGLLVVVVLAMALLGRGAVAASVQLAVEPGPADMVGAWHGRFEQGRLAGRKAADLAIALGPDGPEIVLTLYRYRSGTDDAVVELPEVIEHRVEKGVLYFKTRDAVRLREGQPAETLEADWEFGILAPDAGQLRLRSPGHAAEKPEGKPVPPLPALSMRRSR